MVTISPTLRPAWWPRPGRRRNCGSLISGISSRDVTLGAFGFFTKSSFMSRRIASADDADAVVALGGCTGLSSSPATPARSTWCSMAPLAIRCRR
jgi:hypothetical protein